MGRSLVWMAQVLLVLGLLTVPMGCHEAHNADLITADQLQGGAGRGGQRNGDGDADGTTDEDDADRDMDEGMDEDVGGGACVPDECPMPNPLLSTFAGAVERCCSDDDACGALIDGFCAEYDFPGEPDPDCPSQMVGSFPVEGCCRADGICGIDSEAVGLGCSLSVDADEEVTCGD